MGSERALSQRKIAEAALRLADEEGLGTVSMRRVAGCLGVGTMSLYHHVPSKDALLEGMVELVFERVEQPPEEMRDWAERVLFISMTFRRAALAHPAVVPLVASGSFSGPMVLRSTEAYVAALVRRGFDPETAARVYRAAASYVMGYLSLELGGFFASAVDAYRRGGLETDGPTEYPHLSELAPRLGVRDPEREFEAGLRRLLAGFNDDLNRDSNRAAREKQPDGA
ncbi:TetR/AcrR family transcriptional regulator [Rubrobacter marinus]|uniref:TetR/AcrR family transcriptional regulator n=1 Tax=Rubrobacter marinus TaxID=2653852 RepID=UPI00140A6E94|nr:TetR/AcrR family transcriptional regulator C-terminal domain-containing protein [Rubrobacter marinus]